MSVAGRIPSIVEASVAGVQVACAWLAEAMRVLVSVQCPIAGEDRRSSKVDPPRHSAPGEPPFRESGDGLNSIGTQLMPLGARVGVRPMGIANMIGENYMAGWDSEGGIRGADNRRPWLSTWKRYLPEMRKIVYREIAMQMAR